jgi:hypothetical protein
VHDKVDVVKKERENFPDVLKTQYYTLQLKLTPAIATRASHRAKLTAITAHLLCGKTN